VSAQRYSTQVRVRWSDLDAFGHVNNARTLTLLEEARVDWLFTEAARQGANRLTEGIVVASFDIRYRRPIGFGVPVEVSMGVVALTAVSTTVDYLVTLDGELAVTASSQLVPVDLGTLRPRRWDEAEKSFLSGYLEP
jgi:acyl-CoA thioester hydrolase